jgi:hypothetical protein
MDIDKIQQLNITVLFKEPLNHSAILPKNIFGALGVGEQPSGATITQGPGISILALPKQNKEFIFEAIRILINDNSGDIDKSDLISDYVKISKLPFFNKENIVAYGFNYGIVANKAGGIDFPGFIAESLKKNIADNLESAAVKLNFKRGYISYEFQIIPAGIANQAIIHLHVNFPAAEFSGGDDELKVKFVEKFKELKAMIEKI